MWLYTYDNRILNSNHISEIVSEFSTLIFRDNSRDLTKAIRLYNIVAWIGERKVKIREDADETMAGLIVNSILDSISNDKPIWGNITKGT